LTYPGSQQSSHTKPANKVNTPMQATEFTHQNSRLLPVSRFAGSGSSFAFSRCVPRSRPHITFIRLLPRASTGKGIPLRRSSPHGRGCTCSRPSIVALSGWAQKRTLPGLARLQGQIARSLGINRGVMQQCICRCLFGWGRDRDGGRVT
jgi:hypothetical protein